MRQLVHRQLIMAVKKRRKSFIPSTDSRVSEAFFIILNIKEPNKKSSIEPFACH